MEISTIYWVVTTICFVGYNLFFNKEEYGGGHFNPARGIETLLKGAASLIIYLCSWIVWFIIF